MCPRECRCSQYAAAQWQECPKTPKQDDVDVTNVAVASMDVDTEVAKLNELLGD